MHRVLATKTLNTTRQINDKGDMITKKKEELEKLPFSSRTPRVVQRAKTQLSTNTKTKTIVQPSSVRSKSKLASTNYTDPRQQARDLIFEGIHCTATNQKHDIINQLGNLLLQQINQTEIFQNDVHHLEARNQELENELLSQKSSIEKIQRNTARVTKLRHLKSLRSDENLIQDIRAIESDTSKYVHLSEPWLLQNILDDNNNEDKMEELINLKFRRLEDLIYALRRQILQDQDIVSILPLINERFGSVRNLLTKYDDALQSINKLKVREFKISSDELTKRRPLASYDTQSLHILIVALQNELIECKQQLRKSMLMIKPNQIDDNNNSNNCDNLDTKKCDSNNDNGNDIDLASRFNVLEAEHSTLMKDFEQLKKDNELLKSEINLETDVLKSGLFTIDDKLKNKLVEVNARIAEYYEKLEKMQITIDLQQKLVNQFQKEKSLYLRQKMTLTKQVEDMKEKVSNSEAKVRTTNRKLESLRGVARIMTENTLAKRQDYKRTFDQIETLFFKAYERYDSAALLIQRSWRKMRNSQLEKEIIVSKDESFPVSQILTISAIDVISGKMKPITYKQIVKLLHSYNSEIKQSTMISLEIMNNFITKKHEEMNIVSESVLCKPKRFNWTQTGADRFEVETQTEKMPYRGKK